MPVTTTHLSLRRSLLDRRSHAARKRHGHRSPLPWPEAIALGEFGEQSDLGEIADGFTKQNAVRDRTVDDGAMRGMRHFSEHVFEQKNRNSKTPQKVDPLNLNEIQQHRRIEYDGGGVGHRHRAPAVTRRSTLPPFRECHRDPRNPAFGRSRSSARW